MRIIVEAAFGGILFTEIETGHQLLLLQEEFLEFSFRFRRLRE
jgi:hypothetical protein